VHGVRDAGDSGADEVGAGHAPRELHTWEVRVSGIVQGVNYRYFTQQEARARGVAGWVRNEPDGSVLAVIQHADSGVLSDFVVRLKHGPPHAVVDDCTIMPLSSAQRFRGFEVRR